MPSNKFAVIEDVLTTDFEVRDVAPAIVADSENPSPTAEIYAAPEADPSRQRRKPLTSEKLHLALDVLRIVDVLTVALAGLLVHFCIGERVDSLKWSSHFVDTLVACMAAPFVLERAHLYMPALLRSFGASAKAAVKGCAIVFALLVIFRFATGTLDLSAPTWLLAWSATTLAIMVAGRAATARTCNAMIKSHALMDTMAVVGGGFLADRLILHVSATNPVPVELIGIFDDRVSRLPDGAGAVTGSIDDLLELGKHRRIDRVLITLPWSADSRIIEIVRRLKALSVDVALCPDIIAFSMSRPQMDLIGNLPILSIAERPLRYWNWIAKRIEDLMLGTIALVLLLPALCFIALAIKLDSAGPILFRQRRHGFNNAEIEVFKFRSMRTDLADQKGGKQASRDDPRVTRVGRFIRRSSLDELPQLFNVLRGDMSLVGPRPHPVGMKTREKLCHEIVNDYAHRHRVKPGITGWAQVNGHRGATDTEEQLVKRVEYDLHYIDNWSIFFDIKIMFFTIFKIMSDKNAY